MPTTTLRKSRKAATSKSTLADDIKAVELAAGNLATWLRAAKHRKPDLLAEAVSIELLARQAATDEDSLIELFNALTSADDGIAASLGDIKRLQRRIVAQLRAEAL